MSRKPPPTIDHGRPAPPAGLSERQEQLWREIVGARAPDYFDGSTLPMVHALVRHIAAFELIERQFRDLDLDAADGLIQFERLAKLRRGETASIASISTKLRLTNQSRYTPQRAAIRARDPENRFLKVAAITRRPTKKT